jgi:dTDP-4-amino-4,6-dideoxygalactose transaminase
VAQVLTSGKWAGNGPMEQTFAEKFAAFSDAAYGVCVSSGTTALQTAMEAAGIGAGDEVIVPGLTWIATASAVLATGGVPVFADITEDTFCLDAAAVEAVITPRTRAIVPVHLFGAMADMDALDAVGRRHGLQVIEDAAHSHGSRWRCPDGVVRGAGALGLGGCFSFQTNNLLACGEGGIVLSNDRDFADRCWSARNVGRPHREGQPPTLGLNFRMTEMQAAVLLAGLEALPEETVVRDENGQYLNRRLAQVPGIRPARRDPRVERQAYCGYIFAYDPGAWEGLPRNRFLRAMEAEGIRCSTGFLPVYHMENWRVRKERFPFAARHDPTAREYTPPSCPVTDRFGLEQEVTLPHPVLLGDRNDMDDICRAIEKLHTHRRQLARQKESE